MDHQTSDSRAVDRATTSDETRAMEERYDRIFAGYPKSPTLLKIWRDVYGDDYPEGVDPFGFVTLTDLRQMAAALRVGSGQTILELGSGRGGPGIWVARETGASLIGVDLSPVGVAHANQRAAEAGLADRVRFQTGDMTALDFPDASFDAVFSVDAVGFVTDIVGLMRDIFRLARPGGAFVFTVRERHSQGPSLADWNRPSPSQPDYAGPLRAAGFVVESYAEPHDWYRRQLAVFNALVANEQQLRAEMGDASAAEYVRWGQTRPDELAKSKRIIAIARKPEERTR
jgi:ubiquinone/menaquinone biosynthesis C-methylase UbiE